MKNNKEKGMRILPPEFKEFKELKELKPLSKTNDMKRNEVLFILITIALLTISIGGLLDTINLKHFEKQQTSINQQDSIKWVEINKRYNTNIK